MPLSSGFAALRLPVDGDRPAEARARPRERHHGVVPRAGGAGERGLRVVGTLFLVVFVDARRRAAAVGVRRVDREAVLAVIELDGAEHGVDPRRHDAERKAHRERLPVVPYDVP